MYTGNDSAVKERDDPRGDGAGRSAGASVAMSVELRRMCGGPFCEGTGDPGGDMKVSVGGREARRAVMRDGTR